MRTIILPSYFTIICLAAGAFAQAQDAARPAPDGRERELLAILKSANSEKDKADACMELARVGTRESVAPLAALLTDEKLAHMARYALEPMPEPAVDESLREALSRLSGRPLIGVIGSIGVRKDTRAVSALRTRLDDPNASVVQAAARALGNIGTADAVHALEDALPKASAASRLDFYEGLLRCAEARSGHGETDAALAIYDRLSVPQSPKNVREGAARKARMLRQQKGMTI
jgi:HEAT repeat protein